MTFSMSGFRGKFITVKTTKRRKNSSQRWLTRQLNDPYVSRAKLDGYRSRSAYKLIEIHKKFNLLKPGIKLVDLGAAPGGWSQIASKIIESSKSPSDTVHLKQKSVMIAVDLLEIKPISGVHCLQKNFYDADTEKTITKILGGSADIVMSDMAANTTGHAITDHIRTLNLSEHALIFALKILKPGGHFITKMFRGGADNSMLKKVKMNFHKVKHFKPSSSRKESVEVYLIALHRKFIQF